MSDLIDKKALYNSFADLEAMALEQVKKYVPHEDLTEWRIWSTILAERTAYKHDVFDAPIVDAEPVVRCKECKHYYADPWGYGNCVFEGGVSRRTKDSDFCSWGERREDADNR